MGLIEEISEPYRTFGVTEKGRTFMNIVRKETNPNKGFVSASTAARS